MSKATAPIVVDDKAPAPLPTAGPVPFKGQPESRTGKAAGAPTTVDDCIANNGHGGPDGSRTYFVGERRIPVYDDKTKKYYYRLEPENRVCEICGTVGI